MLIKQCWLLINVNYINKKKNTAYLCPHHIAVLKYNVRYSIKLNLASKHNYKYVFLIENVIKPYSYVIKVAEINVREIFLNIQFPLWILATLSPYSALRLLPWSLLPWLVLQPLVFVAVLSVSMNTIWPHTMHNTWGWATYKLYTLIHRTMSYILLTWKLNLWTLKSDKSKVAQNCWATIHPEAF